MTGLRTRVGYGPLTAVFIASIVTALVLSACLSISVKRSQWIGASRPDPAESVNGPHAALRVDSWESVRWVMESTSDEVRGAFRPIQRGTKRIDFSNLHIENRKLTLTIRYHADIPFALRRIRETAGWLNIREESGHLTMSLPPHVVRRLRESDSKRAAMNMKARLSGAHAQSVKVYAHKSGCLLITGISQQYFTESPKIRSTRSRIYLIDNGPNRDQRARNAAAGRIVNNRQLLVSNDVLGVRVREQDRNELIQLSVLSNSRIREAFGERRDVTVVLDGQILAILTAAPYSAERPPFGTLTLYGDLTREQAEMIARHFLILGPRPGTEPVAHCP